MSLPEDDRSASPQKEMLDFIAVGHGRPHRRGNRLRRHLQRRLRRHPAGHHAARAMVCQWGMSDKLGMVQYGNDNDHLYMGRDMVQRKDYSEFTAQEIDTEVKRIINEAYAGPRA
jgi:cell division protease FtsH